MPTDADTFGEDEASVNHSNLQAVTPNPWPLYVRVLAVMHVLSIPIGVIGWILLSLRAGWLGAQRQFDIEFWIAALAGFGWMGACARYRTWFENWGRRRWPDGKPDPPPD